MLGRHAKAVWRWRVITVAVAVDGGQLPKPPMLRKPQMSAIVESSFVIVLLAGNPSVLHERRTRDIHVFFLMLSRATPGPWSPRWLSFVFVRDGTPNQTTVNGVRFACRYHSKQRAKTLCKSSVSRPGRGGTIPPTCRRYSSKTRTTGPSIEGILLSHYVKNIL